MNTCKKCHNQEPELPPAVLEVVSCNPPVIFHKMTIPAAVGDDTTIPPDTLDHKNVLLVYAANDHVYLYSSDGVPTLISTGAVDTETITKELEKQGVLIDKLQSEVSDAQGDINSIEDNFTELNTTVNNQRDQITQNSTNIAKNTSDITKHTSDIADLQTNLADAVSELQSDIATEALERSEADDKLQESIDGINSNLNQEVEKETDFTSDSSTVTVNHTKVNLSDNTTNNTIDPLPVASETQAGVMNTATYKAVQNNAEDIDTILNGAVALENLSTDVTQEQLTDAWKEATGKTDIVNRASIYDIDNDKVWYYYSNINEWKSLTASTEGEVTISTFTNTTAGIIKGAENDGQVFAEADGTGSVVGWDGVKHDIENLTELVSGLDVPKLYTEYGTNTDGAVTQNFLNTELQGTNLSLMFGSVTTGTNGISVGVNSKAASSNGVAIGTNSSATSSIVIGNNAVGTNSSVAIGGNANSGNLSVAIGNGAKANYGSSNVVIGSGASVKVSGSESVILGWNAQSNHARSIALGAFSSTRRDSELSVGNGNAGSDYETRFIANVKEAELDTDAVNYKQMQDYVSEHSGGASFNPLDYYPVVVGDYETATNSNDNCVNIGKGNNLTTDLVDYGLVNPLYKIGIGFDNTSYGAGLILGSKNINYGVPDSQLPGLDNYMLNFGYNNRVGASGIAIGSNINAGKTGSDLSSSGITIGNNITGWGSNSIAVGHNTNVGQWLGSVAVGDNANATGSTSISIGNYSTASHQNSIALGGATTARANEINIGTGMNAILNGCRYIGKVAPGVNADDAVNVKQLNDVKNRTATYLYTGPSGSANNIVLERAVQAGMEEVTVVASYADGSGRELFASARSECGQNSRFTLSLLVPPSVAGTGDLTFVQDTWEMDPSGTEYDLVSSTTTTIGSTRRTTYNSTSNFSILMIDGHWRA